MGKCGGEISAFAVSFDYKLLQRLSHLASSECIAVNMRSLIELQLITYKIFPTLMLFNCFYFVQTISNDNTIKQKQREEQIFNPVRMPPWG